MNRRPVQSRIRVQGWDLSPNHGAFVELVDGQLGRFWIITDQPQVPNLCPTAVRLSLPKGIPAEERNCWRLSWWAAFLDVFLKRTAPTYVCLEDYALHAKGKVFQIAEHGGVVRSAVYATKGVHLRLYDPTTPKMFAAHNGIAQKQEVESAVRTRWGADFTVYNSVSNGIMNYQTSEDCADAFSLAQLLWTEIELRAGRKIIRDLHPKEIQVFNRTSKPQSVNILGLDLRPSYGDAAARGVGTAAANILCAGGK